MTNLQTYITTRGISQREFARLLDVDPSIVSRLVRDEMRPSLELAAKIESLTRGRIKAVSWVAAAINAAPAAIIRQDGSNDGMETHTGGAE